MYNIYSAQYMSITLYKIISGRDVFILNYLKI